MPDVPGTIAKLDTCLEELGKAVEAADAVHSSVQEQMIIAHRQLRDSCERKTKNEEKNVVLEPLLSAHAGGYIMPSARKDADILEFLRKRYPELDCPPGQSREQYDRWFAVMLMLATQLQTARDLLTAAGVSRDDPTTGAVPLTFRTLSDPGDPPSYELLKVRIAERKSMENLVFAGVADVRKRLKLPPVTLTEKQFRNEQDDAGDFLRVAMHDQGDQTEVKGVLIAKPVGLDDPFPSWPDHMKVGKANVEVPPRSFGLRTSVIVSRFVAHANGPISNAAKAIQLLLTGHSDSYWHTRIS